MTRHLTPATATFIGAAGNKLVADVFGDSGSPVLLLHGGGQTRHAWFKTAEEIARKGHTAYALDQRGHGDSEWVANGYYEFSDYAADAKVVAAELTRRSGAKPIAIGASLGGIAALLAEGQSERDKGANVFSALVLVDITPRVDMSGVAKVLGFMRARAKEGFESIADAAQAVADYLPQRPRPKSNEGLKKNLRLSPDGRWRWHWDPRFLDGPRAAGSNRRALEAALVDAARGLRYPGSACARRLLRTGEGGACQGISRAGTARRIRRCQRCAAYGGGRPQRSLLRCRPVIYRTPVDDAVSSSDGG